MSAGVISGQYVRYIGAGAVATGGILSMLNALPMIAGLGRPGPARPAARASRTTRAVCPAPSAICP